jgi:hypothetical protein
MSEGFIETAKFEVYKYVLKNLDKTDDVSSFTIDSVYVVWFCKTLKNWKALVSTTLLDSTYYEVTFDGAVGSIYLDVYRKVDNIEIVRSDQAKAYYGADLPPILQKEETLSRSPYKDVPETRFTGDYEPSETRDFGGLDDGGVIRRPHDRI